MKSWGVFVFQTSVLSGCWTEQPSPECSLLPVQVPNSDFCKNFQKKFRFPNGTFESLKVYDPHIWSRNMTIFFLSLRLICGVYGQEDVCIPWLHVLLHRRVIQDGVSTWPNPGLMEHGVFGGYGVDGMYGFPFEFI